MSISIPSSLARMELIWAMPASAWSSASRPHTREPDPDRRTHQIMLEPCDLTDVARLPVDEALTRLRTTPAGLTPAEARRRLQEVGPNSVLSHGARPWRVLLRQVESPLLLLLVAAAGTSLVVRERVDAQISLALCVLGTGLGFVHEYGSEGAAERLDSRIRDRTVVDRGGSLDQVDVTELVPGDIVLLNVGDIVPADLRLLEVHGLECDEAVLTGESLPAAKTVEPVAVVKSAQHLPSCALMGTVVQAGTGRGVVVATGPATAFGRIASALGTSAVETGFQQGLRGFSSLLVRVTATLAISIFVINALLHRSLIESALFALAIAVGLTPQLLPAIVTVSLSYGADRLAKRSVLVKRLVTIEDFGNVEVLFTDKTGTLTEGRLTLTAALDVAGQPSQQVLLLGLLCNSAAVEAGKVVSGNPLDRALWEFPQSRPDAVRGFRRLGEVPFDYDRKLMSVLVEAPGGSRQLLVKGAPEAVLERCAGSVTATATAVLDAQFAAGARVVAIGSRQAPGLETISADDERDLELAGFLVFTDPIKADAASALARLARLEVGITIVTGDNGSVAQHACTALGLPVAGVMTGAELQAIDDDELAQRLASTTIFARVTPEQKSRLIRLQRRLGVDV